MVAGGGVMTLENPSSGAPLNQIGFEISSPPTLWGHGETHAQLPWSRPLTRDDQQKSHPCRNPPLCSLSLCLRPIICRLPDRPAGKAGSGEGKRENGRDMYSTLHTCHSTLRLYLFFFFFFFSFLSAGTPFFPFVFLPCVYG